ncbi:MAG: hypothetical protein JXR15_13265 [Shimia sp.]|uniref:PmeII family type II restriction endonuclease n=1 Tax=Shimia sp. TaxID=1954381 RepID=UPI003B8DBF1E
MAIPEQQVFERSRKLAGWWYNQRLGKLKDLAHHSMSTNPFLLPFLVKFHGAEEPRQLAALNVAAHLMAGHHTGFGKLIDEKVLPNVFGTTKLDKATRKRLALTEAMFDDVDHIVKRDDGDALLSLKASRWTIQLGQALSLNRNFAEIRDEVAKGNRSFREIVIGVFYGSYEDLTDKYYLACGVKKTANAADHDLIDVSEYVSIKSGKDFWSWINNGAAYTENALLAGLSQGFKDGFDAENSTQYIEEFVAAYLDAVSNDDGKIDFEEVLGRINS